MQIGVRNKETFHCVLLKDSYPFQILTVLGYLSAVIEPPKS